MKSKRVPCAFSQYVRWLTATVGMGVLSGLLPGSLHAAGEATPASAIHIRSGFTVERMYSVPREQGSWVAICFDDRGRLYVAEQGNKLFRVTPPALASTASPKVELVSSEWAGHAQGMAFINQSLYLVRNGDHRESHFVPDSIVRLSDSNQDDVLDREEHLFDFPSTSGEQAAWTEHGMHAIVPGPDTQSIYVVSGDRNPLPSERGLAPPHWNHDAWGMRYQERPYAGGWVMRADLDGKQVEYVSVGLRNCYDIAFNHYGDLFTHDSDLEFDMGLPAYRPTAIRQILSGADGGWGGRGGHMIKSLGSDFEEIQPSIKAIGPGSPTGVCFGYGASFPARYQHAFFACDWSYGRLFAVHLKPKGASYEADVETFLSAQGLPIVDVAISPKDGALYFVTGGRATQAGLYRVTYQGNESTAPAAVPPLPESIVALRQKRMALEAFHGGPRRKALAKLWPELAHEDRAIRAAARIALEWQPVATWKRRALTETRPRIRLQALLALARSSDGEKEVQSDLLDALATLDFASLGPDEKTWYLRVLTLSAIRHGHYPAEVAATLVKRLGPALPDTDRRVNLALVTLLAHLGSEAFVDPALDLLAQSRTQEEQVVYVENVLRIHPRRASVWTEPRRERFFTIAAEKVARWKGGSRVKPLRERTLKQLTDLLTEAQRTRFAEQITALRKPPETLALAGRPFVKQWTMEALAPVLETGLKQDRNLQNGRALYAATACITCHNFQGEGGLAGPDLSSAGGQYSAHDLLDNILNPSKVINEQYGLQRYTKTDGSSLLGRTVNMTRDMIMIATNPLDPGTGEVRLRSSEIKAIEPSPISFMPPGLLNTLSQDDILDLLAYLRQPPPSGAPVGAPVP